MVVVVVPQLAVDAPNHAMPVVVGIVVWTALQDAAVLAQDVLDVATLVVDVQRLVVQNALVLAERFVLVVEIVAGKVAQLDALDAIIVLDVMGLVKLGVKQIAILAVKLVAMDALVVLVVAKHNVSIVA